MDIVDLSSRRNQGHPLVVVDYTAETIREREWAVHDRIPLKNVTLLSGAPLRRMPTKYVAG